MYFSLQNRGKHIQGKKAYTGYKYFVFESFKRFYYLHYIVCVKDKDGHNANPYK